MKTWALRGPDFKSSIIFNSTLKMCSSSMFCFFYNLSIFSMTQLSLQHRLVMMFADSRNYRTNLESPQGTLEIYTHVYPSPRAEICAAISKKVPSYRVK